MAVKKKRKSTSGGSPSKIGKRRAVEAIFESQGVPGWVGWGTMGAESTYGTNGSYAFGGIALPNSGNNNWIIEARESAKAYRGLIDQYGSVRAAVPHYSGNSYGVAHIRSLAQPGDSATRKVSENAGSEAVEVSWLGDALGKLGGPVVEGIFEGAEKLGVNPAELDEKALEGAAGPVSAELGIFKQAGAALVAFLSMLVDINFWIRTGEAVGAFILIYLGLKELI